MTTLAVNHLSFAYESNQPNILNDITLSPKPSTFNLLIGPSGSGKSTLLKSMAGLYPKYGGYVTGGTILLNNHDISTLAPFERAKRVALLFQNPSRQFAMRTVKEQLIFALENIQMPVNEITPRVNQVIATLRLEPLLERDLITLSGGEQQRVALATVLALDSDIILLDEPFANVDATSRLAILKDLHELQKNEGKTIFISDHDWTGYHDIVDHLFELDIATKNIAEIDKHHLLQVETASSIHQHFNDTYRLSWQQLALSVGQHQLLQANDFALPLNRLGLLSGDNGVGKSTLFNALAHQIKYDGHIYFDGQPTKKIKIKKWAKQLGLVFQKSTDQFVALTVSDEIRISQRHSLAPHYWNDERIQTAIEALNLAHVTQQVSYQLSGGQQKKLQVLVMLIMAQPVLLFDEPLAGLDMTSLTVVLQLIKKTMADLELSVLMISHQRLGVTPFIDYEIHFSDTNLTLLGGQQDVQTT